MTTRTGTRALALCVPLALLPLLATCQGGRYTAQGAVAGGAGGAVSGALSGAFWGLVINDDPGGGAAWGAAAGGLVGAASGAARGAQVDRELAQRQAWADAQQAAAAPPPRTVRSQGPIPSQYDVDDLERRFGAPVVRGIEALIECRHADALAFAEAGLASQEPEHRLAALWLRALAFEDSGDFEGRDAATLEIVAQDPRFGTPAAAGAEAQRVLTEIARARVQLGRSVHCD